MDLAILGYGTSVILDYNTANLDLFTYRPLYRFHPVMMIAPMKLL